jgi:hypothetical protein
MLRFCSQKSVSKRGHRSTPIETQQPSTLPEELEEELEEPPEPEELGELEELEELDELDELDEPEPGCGCGGGERCFDFNVNT